MILKVEGSLIHRTTTGFGPFRKERIENEHFCIEVSPTQGTVRVNEDLVLECTEVSQGWLLQGALRETPCFFGEVMKSGPTKSFSFTMLSVANVELRAKVTPVPTKADGPGKAYVA